MRALVVRVGLHGGDVGVHEYHFDALLLQRLDRLSQRKKERARATTSADARIYIKKKGGFVAGYC